jgi:signal transduction histidine kinase
MLRHASVTPPGRSSPATDAAAEPRRLLIVEDERIVALDLAATLTSFGYVVTDLATTGEEAIAKARAAQPALVVMDVRLAGSMDGIEAAARICRERTVPIVYLTAHADQKTLQHALGTQPLAYLIKPFRSAELRCAIELALHKHEAEAEQRRREHELSTTALERGRELDAAYAELETFAFSVAHDLRTPLRGVDRFSKALLEDHGASLGPEGLTQLARVRAAGERMSARLDQLLRLARTASVPLARRTVDVSALSWSVAEELRLKAPEHPVAIEIEPGIAVDADFGLVRILLENLLGNAWKFSAARAAPRVAVSSAVDADDPVVVVRDNGAGFDARSARHLFGAFRRFHADDELAGAGVGLAIAQRIVHRHGGRIWAESEPGRGATFCFTLGRAPAARRASER